MGRAKRSTPERLAEKLLTIRTRLSLTQPELIARIGSEDIPLYKSDISKYESGLREPPLIILLRYARLAGIPMEILIDDAMELPAKFTKR
jgi:transcriptional regulator with XRE-family HTH domain